MAAFKKGDRVMWSHVEATKHAEKSILRLSPEHEAGEGPGEGQLGEVVGGEGFIWSVKLDGDKEPRDLTADELVRYEEAA